MKWFKKNWGWILGMVLIIAFSCILLFTNWIIDHSDENSIGDGSGTPTIPMTPTLPSGGGSATGSGGGMIPSVMPVERFYTLG